MLEDRGRDNAVQTWTAIFDCGRDVQGGALVEGRGPCIKMLTRHSNRKSDSAFVPDRWVSYVSWFISLGSRMIKKIIK